MEKIEINKYILLFKDTKFFSYNSILNIILNKTIINYANRKYCNISFKKVSN